MAQPQPIVSSSGQPTHGLDHLAPIPGPIDEKNSGSYNQVTIDDRNGTASAQCNAVAGYSDIDTKVQRIQRTT
jgi:hypothetical protein